MALLARDARAGRREGRNIVIEFRWAEGRLERLPLLATELVQLKVTAMTADLSQKRLALLTDDLPRAGVGAGRRSHVVWTERRGDAPACRSLLLHNFAAGDINYERQAA